MYATTRNSCGESGGGCAPTAKRDTLEAWLERLDANRDRVLALFRDTYGARDAHAWLQRWRVFTISCSELFGFRGGREWHVTHVRMRPRP